MGNNPSGEDGDNDGVNSDSTYGGGSDGICVPGKNLGTKGAGPNIGGESSDPLVWSESRSLARRSRRLNLRRRLMMLKARPIESTVRTPTLPPTAPPKVATLCRFVFLEFQTKP